MADAGKGYTGSYTLFLPDSLMKGLELSEVDTLVVRQDYVTRFEYNMMFNRAEELLACSMKGDGEGLRPVADMGR